MDHSDSITRTSSVMAAMASLIIAVSIPVGYFVMSSHYTQGSITAEVAQITDIDGPSR